MTPQEIFINRTMKKVYRCAGDFRRVFGIGIENFLYVSEVGADIDFIALFKALDIPLNEGSREYANKKYGPAAVDLIGRLMM